MELRNTTSQQLRELISEDSSSYSKSYAKEVSSVERQYECRAVFLITS